jgi:hypothetical protein
MSVIMPGGRQGWDLLSVVFWACNNDLLVN